MVQYMINCRFFLDVGLGLSYGSQNTQTHFGLELLFSLHRSCRTAISNQTVTQMQRNTKVKSNYDAFNQVCLS